MGASTGIEHKLAVLYITRKDFLKKKHSCDFIFLCHTPGVVHRPPLILPFLCKQQLA